MSRAPSLLRRALIRIAYLLPAIFGIVMLIVALLPHVFFFYNGAAYETQSMLSLMASTWEESRAMLDGSVNGSSAAYFFSLIMSVFVVLSWVCGILYALTAAASAVCSCIAFAYPPTHPISNRSKRWMQFFCPNRVLYVLSNLLLLLPAAFPQILQHFYRTQFAYDMKLYFIGVNDLILAIVFVVVNVTSFLALLPAQADEHMDLFRLYKSKKDVTEA